MAREEKKYVVETRKKITERVKLIRKYKGLKNYELASILGITEKSLDHKLGADIWTLEDILILNQELNVPINVILGKSPFIAY